MFPNKHVQPILCELVFVGEETRQLDAEDNELYNAIQVCVVVYALVDEK